MTQEPVSAAEQEHDVHGLRDGVALCLSGGGYRAMLFHVGALWRLYETGWLKRIEWFSSVSGGSITAGVLALAWNRLSFDPARVRDDFVPLVAKPLRALADETVDAKAILLGLALPGRISDKVAQAYDRHLFRGATLQDLPNSPRFVINATNLQSGALWRFMKPAMRDWRVGEVKHPTVPLARAVAASSAFPPVLSPVEMRLDPASFTSGSGKTLQREPFTSRVFLADGGVYDNLGLETAWKRFRTILVSDAGAKLSSEPKPRSDWIRHSYRVLSIIDDQVRSLRKRQLIASFKEGAREGVYWGIRTDIADYGLAKTLPCPHERTLAIAAVPTRLKRLEPLIQERLINWGYAVCDAALRRHVDANIKDAPKEFPYPDAAI